MCGSIIPVYFAEVSPPGVRGVFGTSYQFAMSAGCLSVYGLGVRQNWQMLSLVAACASGLALLLSFLLVESPRWLLLNKQRGQHRVIIVIFLFFNGNRRADSPHCRRHFFFGSPLCVLVKIK